MANGTTNPNGVFPPRDKGGVPNSPNICNGYSPEFAVVGDGPLYVSPDCTTVLTDCQLNALASEILAATDKLGYAFNTARVSNLGEAIADRLRLMQIDIDRRILREGDTMHGPLEVICPPANDNDASCKKYVDDEITSHLQAIYDRIDDEALIAKTCCDTKVAKAGDVMTGPLQLHGDPASDGEAANKRYVDNLVASINAFVDAPANGQYYVRKDHDWEVLPSGAQGATITISDTAPVNPLQGDLWWDSTVGQLFIYYVDIDSPQWVAAAPAMGSEGLFLPISGGAITGNLIIEGTTFGVGPILTTAEITLGNQVVTRNFVDTHFLSRVTGGNVGGNVSIEADLGVMNDLIVDGIAQSPTPITEPNQFITKTYLEDAIAEIPIGGVTEQWVEDRFLPLTGGTLTGNLTTTNLIVNGFAASDQPITFPAQFATKAYVDELVSAGGNFLPLAGGIITGNLIVNGSASSFAAITQPQQLATKAYVDGVVLGGIDTSQFFRITGGLISGNVTMAANLAVSGLATTTAAITQPLQFATKAYVDDQITTHTFPDAVADNEIYARQNNAWVPIPVSTGVMEAPIDGEAYVRQDGDWVLLDVAAITGIDGGSF